jgi:hypothetical protein
MAISYESISQSTRELRIIAGHFTEAGVIDAGNGFTVTRIADGSYTITLNDAPGAIISVLVSTKDTDAASITDNTGEAGAINLAAGTIQIINCAIAGGLGATDDGMYFMALVAPTAVY